VLNLCNDSDAIQVCNHLLFFSINENFEYKSKILIQSIKNTQNNNMSEDNEIEYSKDLIRKIALKDVQIFEIHDGSISPFNSFIVLSFGYLKNHS
jgi:hypothetical protein